MAFWVVLYTAVKLWLGDFNHTEDLPLDICNFLALLLPVLMWNPSYKVFEVLYFWIIVGTFQAVLTPHLFNGFPNFIFLKYWFVHAGLIVYTIYVMVVFELWPTFKSIWKSYLVLQGYLVFVLIANLLLGSNYVYILAKPPTASVLDFFGPWPVYVLVIECLTLLFFFLFWLPVRYLRPKR